MKKNCKVCGKKFSSGDYVVPLLAYVETEKRGPFFTSRPTHFVHLACLKP